MGKELIPRPLLLGREGVRKINFMDQKTIVKQLCRDLRKKSTKAERIFWEAVRGRKFEGKKFYRQHPIYFDYYEQKRFFIADFYCHEEKTVVEIDGKIHDYQRDYDEIRTFIINSLNINVVRYKNKEVENNITGVLKELRLYLKNMDE